MGRRWLLAIVLLIGIVGAALTLVASPVRLAMVGCAAIMPGAALPCLVALASQATGLHPTMPRMRIHPFVTAVRRGPAGITVGPDGSIWFAENATHALGRITTGGVIHEFPLPLSGSTSGDVAANSDGSLWFSQRHGIGRMTMNGDVKIFPLEEDHLSHRIVEGADGAMWFTELTAHLIGRVTATGSIKEIPVDYGDYPTAIVTAPDKAIWFTLTSAIGRVDANGTIRYFESPFEGMIQSMCVGRDDRLWFTAASSTGKDWIGRVTMDGTFSRFSLFHVEGFPLGITTGRDGNLWFVDYTYNYVGKMTPSGKVTTFKLSHDKSGPFDIVSGPDGNLWFTELNRDTIGRITPAGNITEYPIPGSIGDEP